MLQGLSPEPRTAIILQDYTHLDMSQELRVCLCRYILSALKVTNPFHTSITSPYYRPDMDYSFRLYNIGSDVLNLSLS